MAKNMSVWDKPQFPKEPRNLENYGTEKNTENQGSLLVKKFDFEKDVSHRTVDIPVQEEILSVSVSRYSNVDMVEMKLSSLQALIEFYDQEIERYKAKFKGFEDDKKHYVNHSVETELKVNKVKKELDEKTKRHQAFENQKTKGLSKGRPKVKISDKALESAYNHMQENATYKDGKKRLSYAKAYRFLQKYHGYEGSDVHLAKCLREKYPKLPKKKVNPVGLAVQERFKTELDQAKKSDQEAE